MGCEMRGDWWWGATWGPWGFAIPLEGVWRFFVGLCDLIWDFYLTWLFWLVMGCEIFGSGCVISGSVFSAMLPHFGAAVGMVCGVVWHGEVSFAFWVLCVLLCFLFMRQRLQGWYTFGVLNW